MSVTSTFVLALFTCTSCFLRTAANSVCIPTNSPIGRLKPIIIKADINEPLKMKCILPNISMIRYDVDETNIGFKFELLKGGGDSNIHTVSKDDIQLPRRGTATLNYSNLTLAYNHSLIHCVITVNKTMDVCVESHQIQAGYRPGVPNINKYVSPNRQSFVFSWSLSHNNPTYRTTYNAYWKNSTDVAFRVCPEQRNQTCIIPDGHNKFHLPSDGDFVLKVNGSNNIGNISEERTVKINDVVKPGKVKNVRVTEEQEPHQVTLTFETPNRLLNLWYNVTWKSKREEMMQMTQIREEYRVLPPNLTMRLSRLHHYANYTITVCANPVTGGFPGDCNAIWHRTSESVPTAAPQTFRGAYRRWENAGGSQDITIHWKRLPEEAANGVLKHIRIQLWGGHMKDISRREVAPQLLSYKWSNLSMKEGFYILVDAATSVGYNETLDVPLIVVPRPTEAPPVPLNFTVIAKDSRRIHTGWTTDASAMDTVTVCWCKGLQNTNNCTEELSWQQFPGNVSTFSFELPPLSIYSEYLFGISSTKDNLGSGIDWSRCTYNEKAVSKPPTVLLSSVDRTSITLSLGTPSCEGRGLILSYKFVLCSAPSGPTCKERKVVILRKKATELYTLEGLKEDTSYDIRVSSTTAAGTSAMEKSLTAATSPPVLPLYGKILIGVGAVLFVACVVISFITCHRWRIRGQRWWRLPITTPTMEAPIEATEFQEVRRRTPDGYNYFDHVGGNDLNADDGDQRQVNDEDKRPVDDEDRRQVNNEVKRRVDDEDRRQVNDEDKRLVDDEGRRQVNDEVRRRVDDEDRRQVNDEVRRRVDDEGRRRAQPATSECEGPRGGSDGAIGAGADSNGAAAAGAICGGGDSNDSDGGSHSSADNDGYARGQTYSRMSVDAEDIDEYNQIGINSSAAFHDGPSERVSLLASHQGDAAAAAVSGGSAMSTIGLYSEAVDNSDESPRYDVSPEAGLLGNPRARAEANGDRIELPNIGSLDAEDEDVSEGASRSSNEESSLEGSDLDPYLPARVHSGVGDDIPHSSS